MTDTDTTSDRTSSIAPSLSPHDPRAVFARAAATVGDVIAAIRPDQLANPTPCGDYDVRQLLEHLLLVPPRVEAIGRGEDPFGGPPHADVADDGWLDAWQQAADRVQAAWSDDATLTRPVELPWAKFDGAGALAMYTSELTVHAWDLATATGQRPAWDEEVLRVSLDSMTKILPAEGRAALYEAAFEASNVPPERRIPPFGEAVPVPDDAPLIDRLVAWTGRVPR